MATYTITYSASGATGVPNAGTKTENVPFVISTQIPEKEGNTFSGWSYNGTRYRPGGTLPADINANITLTAQWVLDTYSITYDANGGTGAPAPQVKIYGQALTLSSVVPTRVDKAFIGWGGQYSETATWQPGDSYTYNGSQVMYAVWRDKDYPPLIYGTTEGTTPIIRRTDSQTTAEISFGWRLRDTARPGTWQVHGEITIAGIGDPSIYSASFTEGASQTGTFQDSYSGLNPTISYTVKIELTDTWNNLKTTYYGFLSPRYSVFEVSDTAKGKSIGIGQAPVETNVPSNGRADFGMDAHFNAEVYDQRNKKLSILTPYHITTAGNTLSAAGWYRAYKITFGTNAQSTGARGACIDFVFSSVYTNSNNTVHRISLYGFYSAMEFHDETSRGSNTTAISKIRYTTNGSGVGYVDVYYNLSTANSVNGSLFAIDSEGIASIEDMGFVSVGSAPSGETIKAEYTFKSNYNEYDDRYYKAGDSVAISSTRFIVAGLVQASSKKLTFEITLPKSIDNISSISVTACAGAIYGINGAIESSSTTKNWMSGYTVAALKRTGNLILIDIQKSSAMSGATTNTPCIFYTSNISLTFS